MNDSEKLRLLAEWIDLKQYQGIVSGPSTAVQDDLREMAYKIEMLFCGTLPDVKDDSRKSG